MIYKNLKKAALLFCTLFILISCSNSDDSNDFNNDTNATMSVELDGENFFLTSNIGELSGSVVFTTGSYGFVINGIEVIDNINLRAIGLGFGGVSFDELSVGDEFVNDTLENSLCTFAITINGVTSTGTSEGEISYVKITSIDKDRQLISGEFNFIAVDIDDPNRIYVFENGFFSNVSYTFLQ